MCAQSQTFIYNKHPLFPLPCQGANTIPTIPPPKKITTATHATLQHKVPPKIPHSPILAFPRLPLPSSVACSLSSVVSGLRGAAAPPPPACAPLASLAPLALKMRPSANGRCLSASGETHRETSPPQKQPPPPMLPCVTRYHAPPPLLFPFCVFCALCGSPKIPQSRIPPLPHFLLPPLLCFLRSLWLQKSLPPLALLSRSSRLLR